MANKNQTIYRLPAHWIGPLFNDDYSGLSDKEEKEVRDFLQSVKGHAVDIIEDSKSFYHTNDACTMPCECCDYVFLNLNNK